MTPLLHFSAGSISLIPRSTFKNTKKDIHLNKCYSKRRALLLLQPTFPVSWISNRSRAKTRSLTSAVEADVAVETDQNPNSETSEGAEPISEEDEEATTTLPDTKVKGIRKNVKKEDLVPGAKFTGIVRSMQPFGVFVDIGSFTDGLVHISQISSDFVKDVKELFTVGQEVEVRLLDYDMKTNRISLSMRDPDDENEGSFKESSRGGTGRGGYTRRRPRYMEGDEFLGTVMEISEEGALVTLPGDGEGFLPLSEQVIVDSGEGDATLEVDQDIMVRVLSVDEDEIILTMKEEEYVDNELLDILKKEEDDFAKKVGKGYEALEEEMEEDEEEVGEGGDDKEVVEQAPIEDSTVSVDTGTMFVNPFVFTFLRSRYAANAGKQLELIGAEKKTGSVVAANPALISAVGEVAVSNDGSEVGSASVIEESVGASELGEGNISVVSVEEVGAAAVETVPEVSESESVTVSNVIEGSSSVVEEAAAISENGRSEVAAADAVSGVAENEVIAEEEKGEDAAVVAVPEVADSENASESSVTEASSGASELEVAEVTTVGAVPDSTVTEKSVSDSQAVVSETASEIVGSDKVEEESDQKEEVSDAAPETREVQATISPSLVKQLREETGAGMMDCKKALAETNGDLAKAQEYLRKKGLASADKKASRATAEGRIGSYVHDGRIGVLIEVNCETDFVSRGDIFKELVEDLAMQVAACPQVTYLSSDDVPEDMVKKEKEIEMQREDILSKPENIREKIVEGRIRKRLEEFALLEQPFIKNDKVVVKDYVKQTIATIGENMKVKRFVRYNLGEGLEKKSQDFAAEVAAQTAAKPAVTAADAAPAEKAETTETAEKAPSDTISISPALVKQLREETGAGMMDCKKALAETGGDIEKAQEYLRKKGLSSADKKSSRLAAEGLISAYIHDSRIGCLIEVNSETDFVARNEKFKELVNDLAMQVVACPQVEYVSMDEVPASVIENEKAIEMQREDLQSKPEQIRERIVEGRISKRLGELALLEQPFIKDDSITVKELVKRTIATLGENIKVRRFVRFTLGESTD